MLSDDINIKQIEKCLYSILNKSFTADNERKKLKGSINRAIDEIVTAEEISSEKHFDRVNVKYIKNQAEKLKESITARGLRDLSNLTQEELQEVIKTALETVTKDPNYKEITEELEKKPNFISGLKKDFREFLDSGEASKKGLSSLVLALFVLLAAAGKSVKGVKAIVREIPNSGKEVTSFTKNVIDNTRKNNLERFVEEEKTIISNPKYTVGRYDIKFLEEYLLDNDGKFSKSKLKDLKEAFRKIGKEVKDQKGNLTGYEIPYYDTSSMRSEIVTLYDLNRLVEKGKSSFREDEKIFKQLLNKFTALLSHEKNIDIKNEIDKERDNERKGRGLISYSSDLYSTPGKFNSFLGRFSEYFDEEKCHSIKKFLQKYIELDGNNAQQLQDKSNGIIGDYTSF